MQAKLMSFYRKDTFTKIFVFHVSGSAEELAQYKDKQGSYYREDDKTKAPLFFSTRSHGLNINGKLDLVPNYEGTSYRLDDSALEMQRELAIENRMLDLEAQERFNRAKYGSNTLRIDAESGEVM